MESLELGLLARSVRLWTCIIRSFTSYYILSPFGLCNAPATFQRVMNYILEDVLGIKALVYLNDVFVKTFEDHLRDIKVVFTLIQIAGLK